MILKACYRLVTGGSRLRDKCHWRMDKGNTRQSLLMQVADMVDLLTPDSKSRGCGHPERINLTG